MQRRGSPMEDHESTASGQAKASCGGCRSVDPSDGVAEIADTAGCVPRRRNDHPGAVLLWWFDLQ